MSVAALPQARRSDQRRPVSSPSQAPVFRRLLVVAALLAMTSTYNGLPLNLAYADVFFVGVIVSAKALIAGASVAIRRSVRVLVILAWAFLTANLFASLLSGGPLQSLVGPLVDLYGPVLAFSLFLVLERWPLLMRPALLALTTSASVAAIALLLDTNTRASAFFPTSNFGAHYLVTIGALLLAARPSSVPFAFRSVTIAIAAAAALATGSFGAVVTAAAMVAYVMVIPLRRAHPLVRPAIAILLLIAATAVGPRLYDSFQTVDFDTGRGLSSQRFERSEDTRIELWSNALGAWASQPLGGGPDTKIELSGLGRDTAVHNDPLALLVDGGPLALIAFTGILIVFWRLAPPAGLARMVIVGIAAGGLFREVINFRHVWVVLAIALWIDRDRVRSAVRSERPTHVTGRPVRS